MGTLQYTKGESILRNRIWNACQQRHLFRDAAKPETVVFERWFSAGDITLHDTMGILDNNVFNGEMQFYFQGEEFMKISYKGQTEPRAKGHLIRSLRRGNASQPFRGGNFVSRREEFIRYSIKGINAGQKSFLTEEGRTIQFEDTITAKDGRTPSEITHHCVFSGEITASPEKMEKIIRQLSR